MTERPITELSIEELQGILDTNELPEGVTFLGLEQRPDFGKLFAKRTKPAAIAKTLLQEKRTLLRQAKSNEPKKPVGRPPKEPTPPRPLTEEETKKLALKEERLQQQAKALEIQESKVKNQTIFQKQVSKRLGQIEMNQSLILTQITQIHQLIQNLTPDEE